MSRLPRTLIAAALLATLAGCSSLLGPKETPSIFAPELATTADPAWPSADWALGTVRPTSARILDGTRIAVSPVPGELQVYKGAMWARTPPALSSVINRSQNTSRCTDRQAAAMSCRSNRWRSTTWMASITSACYYQPPKFRKKSPRRPGRSQRDHHSDPTA